MPQSSSPREVFERFLTALCARRFEELYDIYAEDVVVEIVFAPSGPQRFEGLSTLREHFSGAGSLPLQLEARNLVLHETSDPEVIVAEYDYHARHTTTGQTFDVSNVIVARVRDGRIVSSRDYHDHIGIAAALGRLPQLIERLTARAAAQTAA